MIRCAPLNCPPGSQIRVQDPFSFPHKLPMLVALEAAAHPSDVIIWCDPAEDIAGLFHSMGRVAWPASQLAVAHAVIVRPDAGPGAAGLELGLKDGGMESPVLVSRPFRDEVAVWLACHRLLLAEFLGIEVLWKDYGFDR